MLERLRVGLMGVNAYLVRENSARVLVDPGDDPEAILSFLETRGSAPTLVVATHGHLDHTAAIPALLEAWRPGGASVPLAAHAAEARYFGERGEAVNKSLFESSGGLDYFEAYWNGMRELSVFLEEGDAIPGTAFRVMHTPGHSPGSMCLYDEAAGILLSGDTLFRDGVGRTDFPDSDPGLLEESLERVLALPPDTRVFPGHGNETTIARERRYRPRSLG